MLTCPETEKQAQQLLGMATVTVQSYYIVLINKTKSSGYRGIKRTKSSGYRGCGPDSSTFSILVLGHPRSKVKVALNFQYMVSY